ncbi:unnamed protein product [Euphydryas editha]|uniref:Uncharacterized protein n=1 Tax=Euphydryas editha TaxID=104508 RepID=A0AAU9UAV6_EUPED|nr:unnamed protein product [Euphydryas editha]
MATSYFKLKILKRKWSTLKNNDTGEERNQDSKTDLKYVKKNKCRICLLDGSISIFDDGLIEIRESLKLFGGIEVSKNDNYPEHLCNNCYSFLQKAMLFRKKAQETNLILKKQFISKIESYTCSNEDKSARSESSSEMFEKYYNNNERSSTESKNNKCEVGNINVLSYNELVVHKNSKIHKNVRIQCPICKHLLTTQLYKKHLARHQSSYHLVCDVCGKMYRKDNLVRHLQLHTYELPYRCKICPYRGRFTESLKMHMCSHTGKKPFSCDKCQLRFLTRSNLNRHLLTHNKHKPFQCTECSRGFYTKRDMTLHFTSDHVGFRNFECKLCGNKYSTRKALMRHELKVHKREKMARGRMPLYLQAEYKE